MNLDDQIDADGDAELDALNELCAAAERMLGAANDLWLAQQPQGGPHPVGPLSEEEAQEHHSEAAQRLARAVFNVRKTCLRVIQPTIPRGLFT